MPNDYKKAVIAIAQMMLVGIYYMVSEEKHFNPTDYTELMDSHIQDDKVVLNDKSVFAHLEQQGYNISIFFFQLVDIPVSMRSLPV